MNTILEVAEQEFAHVAAQLTTDELIELDRRVVAGEITGDYFVDNENSSGDCGCFFGSIGLIRGELGFQSGWWAGANFRDTLLGDKLEVFSDEDFEHTVLETKLYKVGLGDTPETNETSAWLHGLLTAEIARRQQ